MKKELFPPISFSIILFIVSLIPTSTLIPLVVIASDNRLYLASLGIIWPLSALFLKVLENSRSRAAAIFTLVFVLACLSTITAVRGKTWMSGMSLWRDALEKAPGQARVHVNYGIELKNGGDLDGAAREYRTAIGLDPRSTWAYTNLGNIYSAQGRPDEAESAYRKAIETAPGNVNARINLSRLLAEMQRHMQAAEVMEEAVSIAPHRADIRHDLGIIYFRYLGDFRRAREQLERSLELDPGQPDAEMMRRAIAELRKLESIQEGPGRQEQ